MQIYIHTHIHTMWSSIFGEKADPKTLYGCDINSPTEYHVIKKWSQKPVKLTCKNLAFDRGVLADEDGKEVTADKNHVVVRDFVSMKQNLVDKEIVFNDENLSMNMINGVECSSKRCGLYKATVLEPDVGADEGKYALRFIEAAKKKKKSRKK